ncbi:MAG: YigZ family protein [Saprospirales bacterium]|nr:YigZ family protein [Saprospirales bacterium]
MPEKDTYKTLSAPSSGEFKDRGSKFIATAHPVLTEEEAMEKVAESRKEHPKARHHCFAWRFGVDGQRFRANDDGEPSGTAGRPILVQIDSFELTNVVVIVVRYFGGTLLGTSGLIQAYRESTAEALRQATIEERILEAVYRIQFDYAHMSPVMNAVKKLGFSIVRQDYGEHPEMDIAIRLTEKEQGLRLLKAHIGELHLDEVTKDTTLEGVEISFLREG